MNTFVRVLNTDSDTDADQICRHTSVADPVPESIAFGRNTFMG
jgi:hypothetical protein